MRLLKSLITISSVTFIALIYVHQQVELVKLSYAIDYKEKKLAEMLDRRENVGYNIANLEDPSRLENILVAKRIDISFPKRGNVFKVARVKYNVANEERLRSVSLERKGNIAGILEFLGLRSEAQAKER